MEDRRLKMVENKKQKFGKLKAEMGRTGPSQNPDHETTDILKC
jgi:hypothetical protein